MPLGQGTLHVASSRFSGVNMASRRAVMVSDVACCTSVGGNAARQLLATTETAVSVVTPQLRPVPGLAVIAVQALARDKWVIVRAIPRVAPNDAATLIP